MRDTERLAEAVRARTAAPLTEQPRRRHGAGIAGTVLALAGVAAVLMFFAGDGARHERAADPPALVALKPVVAMPRVAPGVIASVPPESRTVRHRRPVARNAPLGPVIRSAPVRVEQTRAVPVTRAVAVAPVRLDPPPAQQSLGGDVSVDLPAGKGATILRTDRADVTVVWIYSSRTQQ